MNTKYLEYVTDKTCGSIETNFIINCMPPVSNNLIPYLEIECTYDEKSVDNSFLYVALCDENSDYDEYMNTMFNQSLGEILTNEKLKSIANFSVSLTPNSTSYNPYNLEYPTEKCCYITIPYNSIKNMNINDFTDCIYPFIVSSYTVCFLPKTFE